LNSYVLSRRNPRVLKVSDVQSQADCCKSFAVALYNICSGWNRGLKSALRAMAALSIDSRILILVETIITGGIYICFSSNYNVFASNAISIQQGGIALFCKPNNIYKIEEWQTHGPNIITFVVVLGGKSYYAMGCYIPPTNLTTLAHIEAAWNNCPKGHILILLGDLNIKLRSPRNKHN
jgi:hypothetical protein